MTWSEGVGRRVITVEIDDSLIGSREITMPRVGAVIKFPLRFIERSPSTGDVVTVRAELEPDGRDPIFGFVAPRKPRRWKWRGLLRGDGWTASWSEYRPLTGQVELTGRFVAGWFDDTDGRVRGRVTRVQVVSERYRPLSSTPAPQPPSTEPSTPATDPRPAPAEPPRPAAALPDTRQPTPALPAARTAGPRPAPTSGPWERVPGSRRLREFDPAAPVFDPSRFDQADRDVGLLVELDIDDVPQPPLRPSLVAGDVSAAGGLLWVADYQLPLVVSLDADHTVTEYVLPGRIGPARSVWATASGCWVGGADGTYRCAPGEMPERVDDRPVVIGAVSGETLLACTSGAGWVLHTPGRPPVECAAPQGRAGSIIVDDGDFIVLIDNHTADVRTFAARGGLSESRLVRVDRSGSVTVGLAWHSKPEPLSFLVGSPLRLVRERQVWQVLPDLTLGPTQMLPGRPFHGGQVGEHVWIVGHPPDGTGADRWWPLPGPTVYDRGRQFWLFTLLDAATLEPLSSTPIYGIPSKVTIDDTNTIWVIADGVRAIPAETMRWPELLDVAALLDTSPRPPGSTLDVPTE